MKKESLLACLFLCLSISLPAGANDHKRLAADANPVATIMVGTYGIDWLPTVSAEGIQLTIAGPGDFYWRETFAKGTRPRFAIADIKGQCLDGTYIYELTALPQAQPRARREGDLPIGPVHPPAATQTGSFSVRGGAFLSMTLSESPGSVQATFNEDLHVVGSLCVGTDCSEPETWGYDVLRLKENNLRLHFDDTSSTSSFPANDWRLVINDTADGGANYFAVEDATALRTPFKIMADARNNSIFVSSAGRVGLGTAAPVLNLHIVQGDTPSMRLDQDTSSGWTAQVWDICGNESNFYIRDATGGSKLPFRIQPGTPSSTLCLKSDGYVGIGTWSPDSNLEIESTGSNNVLSVQRTDGATMKLSAMGASGQIGTTTAHAVNFMTNNVKRLSIAANSGYVGIGQTVPSYPLHMGSGAYCTTGGVWTNASSIAFKQDVRPLGLAPAEQVLRELQPVSFRYKAAPEEQHLGFIAEEAPELVASRDRRGMSPMDIVAVLTRVVQEQQQTIEEQRRAIEEQGQSLQEMKLRLESLEKSKE